MRKLLFGIALLVLTTASIAVAGNDPFTGTWRNHSTMVIMKPIDNGISFQDELEQPAPIAIIYGKDLKLKNGGFLNLVRVSDHMVSATSKRGAAVFKETGTVSSNGKHYTRIRQLLGDPDKITFEYDRVGPVPAGDAFCGTWQQVNLLVIKVDGDNFDWSSGDIHVLTARRDGKECKSDLPGRTTYSLKRTDRPTIEIVTKTTEGWAPPALRNGRKEIWQVQGDTLTRTFQNQTDAQSIPELIAYERTK